MISEILKKVSELLSSKNTDYDKIMNIKKEVNSYSRQKEYHKALSMMDDYFTSSEFNKVCKSLELSNEGITKFLHRACKRGENERISYGKYKRV